MWRSKRATRTRYGKIWPLLIFNDEVTLENGVFLFFQEGWGDFTAR
jgi:hypothetical protein